jgi:hypothetical protein
MSGSPDYIAFWLVWKQSNSTWNGPFKTHNEAVIAAKDAALQEVGERFYILKSECMVVTEAATVYTLRER